MNILVTGGLGFIGANFIHFWMEKYPQDNVINVDSCTYAAVQANQRPVENRPTYFFEKADIADFNAMDAIVKKHSVDIIVNFAAESHNSNAVLQPTVFYQTNVMGTQNLLEVVRQNPAVRRLHHVSTCEIYGDMALERETPFTEESPLGGNSPYSSSKAGGNLAVFAYYKTFGVPVTVSSCVNNYGYYQFPEKLIPVFITNLIQGKPLSLYAESHFKREWLHVRDHCEAIENILERGEPGQSYNIGSGVEKSIEEIADLLLEYFGRPQTDKCYVPSRPSHDRRYWLSSEKIKAQLGWEPKITFEAGLADTVEWYIQNELWWKPLLERRIAQENKW